MEISQNSPFMAVTTTEVTSPEFEFWMLGKNPQPSLLTADELFVDGVLLPLHLLSHSPNPTPAESPPEANVDPPPPPPPTTTTSPAQRRKKLKDHIPKRAPADDRRKERRGSAGGPAELNINIWPFSRSRSAGNTAGAGSWTARARAAVAGRKVSSAPCSRSNSRGESSKPAVAAAASPPPSRRWTPSASRVAAFAGGIHLGRTSPVWKIHKKVTNLQAGDPRDKAVSSAKKATGSNAGVRVLNFHVNTCIGYGNRESCSSSSGSSHPSRIVPGGGGGGNGGNSSSSLFKLRTIFSKNNVY
ncbi:hypothetical protein Cni_G24937 [Canna indica]|uniref:Uncharacterized protein n=1 Tax=Canna indica TaxID=4628 RepID=A0AAQ3QQ21_9LILI|nr:hypothetical protein Cni_G24937 [Canna indica]